MALKVCLKFGPGVGKSSRPLYVLVVGTLSPVYIGTSQAFVLLLLLLLLGLSSRAFCLDGELLESTPDYNFLFLATQGAHRSGARNTVLPRSFLCNFREKNPHALFGLGIL